MKSSTKQVIFWIVILIVFVSIGIYLKYASTGATMMALLVGITGIVVGWVARILYVKYVSDKIEVKRS